MIIALGHTGNVKNLLFYNPIFIRVENDVKFVLVNTLVSHIFIGFQHIIKGLPVTSFSKAENDVVIHKKSVVNRESTSSNFDTFKCREIFSFI